jgi:hypothetical protein
MPETFQSKNLKRDLDVDGRIILKNKSVALQALTNLGRLRG